MNKGFFLFLSVLVFYKVSLSQVVTASRVDIVGNVDNAVTSTYSGKYHQMIGTYAGWDPNAVFIGGYNAGISSSYSTQKVVIGNHAMTNNFLSVDLLNGNVGVGISSPSSKLEVNGPVMVHYASGSGPLTAGSLIRLGSGGNDVAIQENWGINLCGSPTQPVKVYNSSLMVGYPTSGLNVGNNNLFVENNVGIGTVDTKGYKLAVNGTAIFTKVQVKAPSNPWPDYVFHPTYNLRSLSSLEAFININKHLPDVPSANEVEANGVDIAATQAVLLRKIEELTLYIIEQDKTMKIQAKQIKKLQATYSSRK